MIRFSLTLAAVVLIGTAPASAKPPKLDRKIRKEPVYQTRTPKYGILMFGMEGKDRVWMVQDGDALYVDRNGDGDLTEPGKKVKAERWEGQTSEEEGFLFEAGDVTLGGRTHKALRLTFSPLKRFASSVLAGTAIKEALAKDQKAWAVIVSIDVDVPGFRGNGIGGRPAMIAGPIDKVGVLQFNTGGGARRLVWRSIGDQVFRPGDFLASRPQQRLDAGRGHTRFGSRDFCFLLLPKDHS
jgi:hypothetical protein